MRCLRTGFKCLPENIAAKCLAGRYCELLARMSWRSFSPCKDKTNQQQIRLIWLKNPGEGSWLRSSSRNNTTFQYGCKCLIAVFKTEMMGEANLDLLKAFSAEAVTLLNNDPHHWGWPNPDQHCERLPWITFSQHFKILVSQLAMPFARKLLLTRQSWMWQG